MNGNAFPRPSVVWADRKYRNDAPDAWPAGQARLRVEVMASSDGAKGFVPIKVAVGVERTNR